MANNPTALKFESQRYVRFPTGASIRALSSFTWMAWLKVDPASNSQYMRAYVERQGTNYQGIRFACTPFIFDRPGGSRLRFEFSANDGSADTNYDYKFTWDDRWHHVAFVARLGSSASYSIILDGYVVADGNLVVPEGTEKVADTAPLGVWAGGHSLHTSGGESMISNRFWTGKMDEVLIFNTAKSESDIRNYVGSHDHWDLEDENLVYAWRFANGSAENVGPTSVSPDKGGNIGVAQFLTSTGAATQYMWTIDRPFLGNGQADTTPPGAPGFNGTTNITADAFTANWTLPSDNVWVRWIELQVSEESGFTTSQTFDCKRTTSRTVTGLVGGTNYYWRVRAYDEAGNAGNWSAIGLVTTAASGDQAAPNPPVATAATNIGHLGFRMNWNPSSSSDVTGYKIDVARDTSFKDFLIKNRDVGNVLFYDVSGCEPLTDYYYRVRAYDGAYNESADSQLVMVRTLPVPDINPPNPVQPITATEVTASGMTANWLATTDDVGVSGYYLDVATDHEFTSLVETGQTRWQRVPVGVALSARVDGLQPGMTYYYRVWARDEAGNESAQAYDPIMVETLPASLEEGGYLFQELSPVVDTVVTQTSPDQTGNLATTLTAQGNGAGAPTSYVYFSFDLSHIAGRLSSALLHLPIAVANSGTNTVGIAATAISDDLTWNTRPGDALFTTTTTTFTAPPGASWVSLDLTAYINQMAAGMTTYTIRVSRTDATPVTFYSSEYNTNGMRPSLELEIDPASALQPDFLGVTTTTVTRQNLVINPSFETSTTGWTGVNGTIARTSGTNVAVAGMLALSLPAGVWAYHQNIYVTAGQDYVFSAYVTTMSATAVNSFLEIEWYNSANTLIATATTTFSVAYVSASQPKRVWVAATAPAGAYYARPRISRETVTGALYVDGVLFEKASHLGAYFDGTSNHATWQGTANASISNLHTVEMTARATYLGDENQNATARFQIRQSASSQWVDVPTQDLFGRSLVTYDRANRAVTSRIVPYFPPITRLRNAGAEWWTSPLLTSGGATITQSTEAAKDGMASWKMTLPPGSGAFVYQYEAIPLALFPGGPQVYSTWTLGAWLRGTVDGAIIRMRLEFRAPDNTNTIYSEPVTLTDEWDFYTITTTAPANADRVICSFSHENIVNTNGTPVTVYADNIIMTDGDNAAPFDLFEEDGLQMGNSLGSWLGRTILDDWEYEVRAIFDDPDGIFTDAARSNILSTTVATPRPPDNALTFAGMSAIPGYDNLYVEFRYTGDDNQNSTAIVEYCRADLNDWTLVRPSIDRTNRKVIVNIPHLRPGTEYKVKVTFTDPNGIVNGATQTGNFTTLSHQFTPDGTSRISFGGFVLQGRDDGKIAVMSHNAFGLPDRRVQVEDRARQDGADKLQSYWGRRTISMDGFIWGETRGELADNVTTLRQALALADQRLVFDTLSNTGRHFTATATSFKIKEDAKNPVNLLYWSAEFVCADPFSYDQIERVVTLTAMNGSEVSIPNDGTALCDMQFVVTTTSGRPVTFTIQNMTTGDHLRPEAGVKSGDRYTIDSARQSCRHNGIEVAYQGAFPQLAVGENRLRFVVEEPRATAPSVNVEIRYRQRYF